MKNETPWTKGPWRLDDISYAHVVDSEYHVIEAGGYNADTDQMEGFTLSGIMSPADAALIVESPAMAELLEAIDKSWTAYWPQGPDYGNHTVKIAEDTAVIWRGIRAVLARLRSQP